MSNMEKKLYISPALDIVLFNQGDILNESIGVPDPDDLPVD